MYKDGRFIVLMVDSILSLLILFNEAKPYTVLLTVHTATIQ